MDDDLLPVEALERLSRQDGVDIRPILLRVLTDLFVQKAHHAPQEIIRYEELALPLLDVVGVETRAVVARKLAEDERAPAAVIRRLLDDDFEVAAPIIARSAKAPRQLLLTLALDGDAAEASAVARRADVDGDMVRMLAHHADDRVLETLAANPAVNPSDATLAALVRRAQDAPTLAASLLRRADFDAAGLSPLYLQADPERRADIRASLAARPARASASLRSTRAPDAADAAMVEAALESGTRALIADALGDALAISPATAATLAAEPSGEPFVMMLRAIGVERDQIARALLIAQPEIAKSVPRFFELVEIAETTPRAVASELLAALTGGAAPAPARHEPLFDPSGVPERPGAARALPRSRRPLARPGEIGRQRG